MSANIAFVKFFEWFGDLGIFCGRLAWAAFVPPYEGQEFVRQVDELGSKSLPLVALAGAATGVVLALQTRDSLVRFGAKSLLPAVIVISIIKETGPIWIATAKRSSSPEKLAHGCCSLTTFCQIQLCEDLVNL